MNLSTEPLTIESQSARGVEYIDGISAEGWNYTPHNVCPKYDIKQSDGEPPA